MATSLSELAALVAGTVHGNPETLIAGASPLNAARAGEITLVDQDGKIDQHADLAASAVVIPQGSQPPKDLPAIEVEDLHGAFSQIVMHFRPPREATRVGVSSQATIDATACLADDVDVYPGASIGADVKIGSGATLRENVCIMAGCKIGEGTTIMPGAVLYEETEIGAQCLVHANAVLGAYGFGYQTINGRHERCAQLGNVVLEDNVEIGAGTSIDRGVYGSTRIGEGSKIDNLVQIGHNCRLGKHNMICSQVGIAGSTTTGDYVVMAGQVGVRDHVHIGDQAVLGAKAGISNHVPEKTAMIGIPATPEREQKIKQAALAKLPEMRRQFKALQREIKELQTRLGGDQDSSAAA